MSTTSPNRQPRAATLALREAYDAFHIAFEDEFRGQATKANAASERRMRQLLRNFHKEIYVPYRDATLGRGGDEE